MNIYLKAGSLRESLSICPLIVTGQHIYVDDKYCLIDKLERVFRWDIFPLTFAASTVWCFDIFRPQRKDLISVFQRPVTVI